LAIVQQVCAVGDRERLLHIVVGDEHAYVALLQLIYNFLNVLNRYRVYTCKGFIKQNILGIGSQCASNFCAPSFSSTERASHVGALVCETKLLEERFQLIALLILAQLRHFEHSLDVVFNRQLAKYAGFLR
jgi:hypothetical protein